MSERSTGRESIQETRPSRTKSLTGRHGMRTGMPSAGSSPKGDGAVVGFGCVSLASQRAVYAGVGEVMVYVAEGSRGDGVGGGS